MCVCGVCVCMCECVCVCLSVCECVWTQQSAGREFDSLMTAIHGHPSGDKNMATLTYRSHDPYMVFTYQIHDPPCKSLGLHMYM